MISRWIRQFSSVDARFTLCYVFLARRHLRMTTQCSGNLQGAPFGGYTPNVSAVCKKRLRVTASQTSNAFAEVPSGGGSSVSPASQTAPVGEHFHRRRGFTGTSRPGFALCWFPVRDTIILCLKSGSVVRVISIFSYRHPAFPFSQAHRRDRLRRSVSACLFSASQY